METKNKLEQAVKDALKAGDELRKRTVRHTLAAIKQVEIDLQSPLDETAVLGIIQKEIKNRREALEEAQRANRQDLIASAEAEIGVLNDFLPKAMDPEELKELVEAAIAEAGAASLKDMGKVMKLVLPQVAGRAPGDQISALVQQLLSG